MKNSMLFVLLLTSIFISCTPYYQVVDTTNRPKEILTDTLAIVYDVNENKFTTASVGGETILTIDLRPGQIYKVEPGKPLDLVFRSINLSVYTLFSRYNEKEDVVELGLVRTAAHKIELNSQCETIRWMDPYYVPKIEVSDELKVHQIVITPIMDDNCEKKGYEIRYGSQDRGGCRSEAEEVFKRYVRCTGNPKPTSKRISILDVLVEWKLSLKINFELIWQVY